jgi:5-(carboxyamino)imidazole ribonucleotide synthase
LKQKKLGFYVTVLDPTQDCPAHSLCDEHIVADFEDKNAFRELASKSDVITYEFEHINAEALLELEAGKLYGYPYMLKVRTGGYEAYLSEM